MMLIENIIQRLITHLCEINVLLHQSSLTYDKIFSLQIFTYTWADTLLLLCINICWSIKCFKHSLSWMLKLWCYYSSITNVGLLKEGWCSRKQLSCFIFLHVSAQKQWEQAEVSYFFLLTWCQFLMIVIQYSLSVSAVDKAQLSASTLYLFLD